MKRYLIVILAISAILAVFVLYNPCLISSYTVDYYDSNSFNTFFLNCIKILNSKTESNEESTLCSISYRFINLKKHEVPKVIKKESKYRPICYKSNLDGRALIKNTPCFLSHIHFATSDQNADRGCKNKYL